MSARSVVTCLMLASFSAPSDSSQSLALLRAGVTVGQTPRPDSLDRFIQREMARRHIPGLSIAIIEGGKIVKAHGYGVTEFGSGRPVTASTLFQAGSISKSLTALGALHLVEQGRLSLDEDVNSRLTTWKVPENAYTASAKVTVRGILSHSAGITVSGFSGYASDAAVPTLVQVLNGAPPANSAPIRVDTIPGSVWRYSGGGYAILQQLIIDVTGEPFPRYMHDAVLAPLGMDNSSYDQPLPPARAAAAASAYERDRSPVAGHWHIYPEMAAAGLWTTPSDLARFALGLQAAVAGMSDTVISRSMARQMVAYQRNDFDGLGVFLQGNDRTLAFYHTGRDEGFDAKVIAYAATGQGAAIMINTNDNTAMSNRIIDMVGRLYRWPGVTPGRPVPVGQAASMPAARLRAYEGRYEVANNRMATFVATDGHLVTMVDGFGDEEFVPIGADRFVREDGHETIAFVHGADGRITGLVYDDDEAGRHPAPRIGPFVNALRPRPDPDTALTRRIDTALAALRAGGAAVANASPLTAGARRELTGPGIPDLRLGAFVAEEDVAGRGLVRHEGTVARIRYYRVAGSARSILVYLTSDGAVTDYDVVTE